MSVSPFNIFVGETIGTFFLTSSIIYMTNFENGGQATNILGLIVGFFIAVNITRKISGANLNPAVTLLFFFKDNEKNNNKNSCDYTRVLIYMGAQFLGAFFAVLLGLLLYNNLIVLSINQNSNPFSAFTMEYLGSCLFYLIILVQCKHLY